MMKMVVATHKCYLHCTLAPPRRQGIRSHFDSALPWGLKTVGIMQPL